MQRLQESHPALLEIQETALSKKLIKFNEPYLTGKEQKYIDDVFERKQFYGNGFYTNKCQNFICHIMCKYLPMNCCFVINIITDVCASNANTYVITV